MARDPSEPNLLGVACPEQDCQIEHEYTPHEWERFVECAKQHWAHGWGLDNDFESKRPKHPVPDSDIERTIDYTAQLLTYDHWGKHRVGIWRAETGVLLVLKIAEDGNLSLYNAIEYDNIGDPTGCGDMENVRWLKQ